MTIDEFIASLKLELQNVAQVYLPILTRWAADEGWNVVRQNLYAKKVTSWYRAIRKHMTDAERDADDKRALSIVKMLAIHKADLIDKERDLLQQIVTLLITALLAKL
jgi:hypothetical protein